MRGISVNAHCGSGKAAKRPTDADCDQRLRDSGYWWPWPLHHHHPRPNHHHLLHLLLGEPSNVVVAAGSGRLAAAVAFGPAAADATESQARNYQYSGGGARKARKTTRTRLRSH